MNFEKESRVACNPVISNKLTREEVKREHDATIKNNSRFQRRKCLASGSSEVRYDLQKGEGRAKKDLWYFCNTAHSLEACSEFSKISLQERRRFIQSRGLCHRCLTWGHICRDCVNKRNWGSCSGTHPTILHDESLVANKQVSTKPVIEEASGCVEATRSRKHPECFSHSLIVLVWLHHLDKDLSLCPARRSIRRLLCQRNCLRVDPKCS